MTEIFERQSGVLNHKVADICFTSDNKKIMDLLKKRGAALTHHDFEKVTLINRRLSKVVIRDQEKLKLPNAAFITFESEVAYNYWSKLGKVTLFNENVKLTEA